MIRKRRVARARRIELQRVLLSHLEDLRAEAEFETSLAAATRTHGAGLPLEEWRCFSEPHLAAWCAPLTSRLEQLQTSFELDARRAARPPPAELLLQLRAARREKIANKTRERAREARGEVLMATRRRARLGFPAHVLARWTPAVRKAKLLARRCVGEVGYVGIVKRALGYGVRSLEEEDQVDEATRERLDRLTEEVRRVSQSRRDREERVAEGCVLGPRKAGAA